MNNELVDYLIHLLKCGLNGEKPDEKPENISFEDIFRLAKMHSVANLAYYAVERLDEQPLQPLAGEWREVRDKAVVKGITQLYERDMVIEALTGAGINICPLKGCLLKEMYPQQDMRMMSDLDILMEHEKAGKVQQILKSMGYSKKSEYEHGHDIYYKKPVMDIEMHHLLMDRETVSPELLEYYKNDWERLIADKDNPHLYYMTWNDYYIYFIAHLSKHYYSGGTGIRSIMDIHIFLKNHRSELNQNYLKQELEKMKLWELKENCEKLAEVWFGDREADETLYEMTEYIVQSGTYGVEKTAVLHRVDKELKDKDNSKFRYYVFRMFPPYEKMKWKYNILKKQPYLLPVFWIWRLISGFADKSKIRRLKIELQTTRSIKNKS